VSRHRLILLIAFVAFIALGMPKAAFGVAWPSMAIDLSAPLADLGLFVAIHTGAYFVASLVSGRLSHRIGNGPMLTASAWALALGLAGYAVAPNRLGLALAAVVLGLGGGLLDAGINAHVALDYGARAMGLLHASFGIGATMGPLVMTVILALDGSWRIGFALLVALQAGIAIAIWRTSADWDTAAVESGERPRLPSAQRATAVLAVLVFVLIGGIEVSTGSWTYTLLTEGRAMGEAAAGLAVTGFWGAFTAARLLLGAIGDRVAPDRVLKSAAVGTVIGTGLLWWNPIAAVGALGLIATGFALGFAFPLQMLLTPRRFGAVATPPMAGYQLAGATVGAVFLPLLIGQLVAAGNLEVVGPVLWGAAVALLAITLILARQSPSKVPAASSSLDH